MPYSWVYPEGRNVRNKNNAATKIRMLMIKLFPLPDDTKSKNNLCIRFIRTTGRRVPRNAEPVFRGREDRSRIPTGPGQEAEPEHSANGGDPPSPIRHAWHGVWSCMVVEISLWIAFWRSVILSGRLAQTAPITNSTELASRAL